MAGATFSDKKNSLDMVPYFAQNFPKFRYAHQGRDVNGEIPNITISVPAQSNQVITQERSHITSSKGEWPKYRPMSTILTRISLDLSSALDSGVLVFVENSRHTIAVQVESSMEKPDLVAFFAPRSLASKIANSTLSQAEQQSLHIPPAHQLVSVVEMKVKDNPESQCLRYLYVLSRHRPASYMQYGLIANKIWFRLICLGLDRQVAWPQVRWNDKDYIKHLYHYTKLILDEAKLRYPPEVPRLIKIIQVERRQLAYYTIRLGEKEFVLLPISTGWGNGRKPFVALASDGTSNKTTRVFKMAWYKKNQLGRESTILKKLEGMPGVVQIDRELSVDVIEAQGQDDKHRTRSLLAMKTMGSPLGSCGSVLEFLETMFDLLEVLRFLVQEKEILHRDVSWMNVLITPKDCGTGEAPKILDTAPTQDKVTAGCVPHKYRFMSDVLDEPQRQVRTLLTDFDHAIDLSDGNKDDLKDATGTPMFMAHDVIKPRSLFDMMPLPKKERLRICAALARRPAYYSDSAEQAAWDEFYQKDIQSLPWIADPDADDPFLPPFQHGAMHDAESVFNLCLLFFNRFWPLNETVKESEMKGLMEDRGQVFQRLAKKRVTQVESRAYYRQELPEHGFYNSNKFPSLFETPCTINSYISIPWYNVEGTGRGQPHEFHLHDFMQRLLLQEIQRLRESGDPIRLEDNPLPVKAETQYSGNEYTSNSRLLRASLKESESAGTPVKRPRNESDEQADPVKRPKLSGDSESNQSMNDGSESNKTDSWASLNHQGIAHLLTPDPGTSCGPPPHHSHA
ncbi:hypothetical protein AX16_002394 [Volvariella volvacea WC 439]|nr:hypothetical protein AX16_002394 [Volvariella volvacea WC 439]